MGPRDPPCRPTAHVPADCRSWREDLLHPPGTAQMRAWALVWGLCHCAHL